jgi:hypothetical protein
MAFEKRGCPNEPGVSPRPLWPPVVGKINPGRMIQPHIDALEAERRQPTSQDIAEGFDADLTRLAPRSGV